MTEEELKAIEARANAAAPGPWTGGYDGRQSVVCGWRYWACGPTHLGDSQGRSILQVQIDQEFINHVREDVPALCEEVRRLQAESAALSQFIQDTVNDIHNLRVDLTRRLHAAKIEL